MFRVARRRRRGAEAARTGENLCPRCSTETSKLTPKLGFPFTCSLNNNNSNNNNRCPSAHPTPGAQAPHWQAGGSWQRAVTRWCLSSPRLGSRQLSVLVLIRRGCELTAAQGVPGVRLLLRHPPRLHKDPCVGEGGAHPTLSA